MRSIVLNILTSLAAVAAAVFAAWTAWISRASAKAAERAVGEAIKARKAQLSPRLVLERNFLDFHFIWPHRDSINGEAVFLARRHGHDNRPVPPTFSLTNYGSAPALEVEIVFELDDPNGEYSVPDILSSSGLRIVEMQSIPNRRAIKTLYFPRPDGGAAALPLYSKWTTDIPHSAPGQTRTIDFPQHLLNTLFLRGLQYRERCGQHNELRDITLTVRIACHTVEEDAYSTQFRFKTFPYWHGSRDPLTVNGHFYELPMFAKSSGDRTI